MTEINPTNKVSKAKKAFSFMLKKEQDGHSFTLDELISATGWKKSTIKTYMKKQWRGFIRNNSDGTYRATGLTQIDIESFIKAHSQKLKFQLNICDEIDHLASKAKEFGLLAVYTYNNPYSDFKTYGFIVNIIIAWTSLLHAIFQRDNIDYFHKNKDGSYTIIDGDKKAWELSSCINTYWSENNPIKSNLNFLIGLRNKIEHRFLPILDLKIAGHCQSCVNNFEKILIEEFGDEYALNRNTALALQLTRSYEQKLAINEIQAQQSFNPVKSYIDDFEAQLPDSFLKSPEYRISFFLTPKATNQLTSSSLTIEIAVPNDIDGNNTQVIIKEKEKEKFKPKQIVNIMNEEGYKKFTMPCHTKLWQQKKAKRDNSFGTKLSDGSWYWYTSWVDVVRTYCKENDL